jgi:predicted permease
MVTPRTLHVNIAYLFRNERARLKNSLSLEKINSFPALIGFFIGAIFIILHWFVQQVSLAPKKLLHSIYK